MSELALKLIAENKRTRATSLDLGNCGLVAVPEAVGELVWLESLSFATSWAEWDGGVLQYKHTQNQDNRNRLADISRLRGLTRLRLLALSDTQVSDLAPLAGLSALQSLDISGTQVSDLALLAGLSALQSLDVSGTRVFDLVPLAGLSALESLNVSSTHVSDLAPLAGLSALQHLRLVYTWVSDLAPLADLLAMRSLYVRGTQVSDLAPLTSLAALQTLDASTTHVSDLAPLAALPVLQSLNVAGTEVSDLSPLAGLSTIQSLKVWRTEVSDLAPLIPLITRGCRVRWSSESWRGPGIYVENCPLAIPPPDIVKQGNSAILNYFRELSLGGVDHLYEAKMLILGEGGAGKTSLLRRLYQPGQPLPTEKDTTRGIEIYRHEFTLNNGRRFRLNVWDFGGQEIYHATHQFFLTRRSLYLLVDDTRKDHKSVSDEGFKYWLELIDVLGGRSPVLIFQNEKGGRSKAIDLGGIKGRYENVKELYTGNLEHSDAADRLRAAIEFFAGNLSHIGEELPARWIQVRADIESRAAEVPHISQQDYFEIYRRHMEFDWTRALHLSRYLHDLGVFLHFQDDPLLARTVILQNQWATEAVFRILDDEIVKGHAGRFNAADCERLLRDTTYADMHPELLALMQRFELCYELRDSKPAAWLAPQLLRPAKPEEFVNWGEAADMVLRYRYDFLPKGVISRLTVRLNRFVRDPEKAWVSGVLFQRDKTSVLVELLATGNEIELRGRGPERKELLSVIAADLDALNDSFQGLRDKVDKFIPCHCKVCLAESLPEFFSQKALLRRKEDRRLKVECPRSYEDVDVLQLLDGVRMDDMPGWGKQETAVTTPRRVRIFLASAAELRADRDAFDLYFRQRNDQLANEGFYLEIVRWEHFLDAISDTRLQDEYNKKIRECDICVCLFFTKVGKFTEEEFGVAYEQFKTTGKPRIYTYFKNADIKTGHAKKDDLNSLWAFQERLTALGHFHTNYDNIDHLHGHFREQLDMILE